MVVLMNLSSLLAFHRTMHYVCNVRNKANDMVQPMRRRATRRAVAGNGKDKSMSKNHGSNTLTASSRQRQCRHARQQYLSLDFCSLQFHLLKQQHVMKLQWEHHLAMVAVMARGTNNWSLLELNLSAWLLLQMTTAFVRLLHTSYGDAWSPPSLSGRFLLPSLVYWVEYKLTVGAAVGRNSRLYGFSTSWVTLLDSLEQFGVQCPQCVGDYPAIFLMLL